MCSEDKFTLSTSDFGSPAQFLQLYHRAVARISILLEEVHLQSEASWLTFWAVF